jgi:NifU-like protein involved in Fe-S cluster formation
MRELSAAAWAHFERPRNVGSPATDQPNTVEVQVGEPVSGAVLRLHLQFNEQNVINQALFQAYGCGWLIACGSLLTELLQNQTMVEAGHFRHHTLVERLEIPPEKLYCAVLAETALKSALRAFAAKHSACADPEPTASP